MSMEFGISNLDFGSTLVAIGTSNKTQVALLAQTATLRRGRVKEMNFGPFDNPQATDFNIVYSIWEQGDNAGTADTVTPYYLPALEAGTPPASGALAKTNYTAEPGMKSGAPIVYILTMNQHSSFQWYAPQENSLEWAAVNNTGFAFRARGASAAVSTTTTVHWRIRYAE